jgi:hypothetical protein
MCLSVARTCGLDIRLGGDVGSGNRSHYKKKVS